MGCMHLVSAESLEKSLKQMEGQIKQLGKDLETFPQSGDPHDKFVTKMSISFCCCQITEVLCLICFKFICITFILCVVLGFDNTLTVLSYE